MRITNVGLEVPKRKSEPPRFPKKEVAPRATAGVVAEEATEPAMEEKAPGNPDGGYKAPAVTGRAVPPDSVQYRPAYQHCGNCEYMGGNGMCSWLKMQVEPMGSCAIFEERGEEEAEERTEMATGEEPAEKEVPVV